MPNIHDTLKQLEDEKKYSISAGGPGSGRKAGVGSNLKDKINNAKKLDKQYDKLRWSAKSDKMGDLHGRISDHYRAATIHYQSGNEKAGDNRVAKAEQQRAKHNV